MLIEKAIGHIREYVWQRAHLRLCEKYRNKYINHDVSIISMNCTGGILYHDLGLKFLSPTINLFFRAEDFIKFCENLDYYLSIDQLTECHEASIIGNRKYPVAYLGDILLFLVHYDSVVDAQDKWNQRKKHINKEKIVILNTNREGMTDELMERFDKLPYKRIMFVNKQDDQHLNTYYIKGYEKENNVGIIKDHIGWSGKRPIDQFDWVAFLNDV